MKVKKEKQMHILTIIIAILATLVILFEVFVKGDKFIDHLLTASLVLALFGTSIIQLNEMKKKKLKDLKNV